MQADAAGTITMGTTMGCVREKKSTKSFSNIRGESSVAFIMGVTRGL